ncbi:type IV secretion system protein [Bartonella machadoae]|uniref:type IV secretion system protein n=1 Tax=Bartonella machadoae TaxID=2893471 RepID=UPI001F4CCB6D|nr:type IV secretion system protein [Bartonella machadoae]UNE54098.1 hypothetical protein LNM86_11240 [Bartonella machadoae]
MKKLFIIAGIVAFLGIPNLSLASDLKTDDLKEIQNLLTQHAEVYKQQLEEEKKIYNSITGNKKEISSLLSPLEAYLDLNLRSLDSKTPKSQLTSVVDSSTYLLYARDIYRMDRKSHTFDSKEYEEFSKAQELDLKHEKIDQRLKHAIAVDKAVSLQTFHEAEDRFTKIKKMLEETGKTQDLKTILRIQAQIKGMLATLENEAGKLQMVAHFRNAEQAFIKQQKRALRLQTLKGRKGMPTIRINGNVPT